jgi:hypothetical protein
LNKVDLILAATTLSEFKQFILKQVFPSLGDDKEQPIVRIFHLGRELKSVQRTLEKLGVGRHPHNAVLHVQIRKPPLQQALPVSTSMRRITNSDNPGTVSGIMTNSIPTSKPIIDLLDDNDDDHENNDETVNEVLVIDPPSKRRRL